MNKLKEVKAIKNIFASNASWSVLDKEQTLECHVYPLSSPHFLVHTRPLMMMMMPVKTLLPLLRFTNCRVPVLSVAWAQLVCLNDSMRGSQCWVTKAGDTGMGHDDGDTRTLLRSSSLWLAVSSSSSDYNTIHHQGDGQQRHRPIDTSPGTECGSVLISSGRHWSHPHGHGDWGQGVRNVIIRTGKQLGLVTGHMMSPVIAETLCSATEQWAA